MADGLTDIQPSRTLPRSLARVAAELEMRQARMVSRGDLAGILGVAPNTKRVDDAVEGLVARGWLRPLPVRGTYEFLPAAGGPWESGDPWIELRAVAAKNPKLMPQIVLGSAAFLRGFSDRRPTADLIAVNADVSLPPGLRKTYRVIRTTPHRLFGASPIDGLPVATPARLVLEVALWWKHAGDVWSPDHWIRSAFDAADLDELHQGAQQLGGVVVARTGHIAHQLGIAAAEQVLNDLPRPQPVFFGPRPQSVAGVSFDSAWGVYDTLAR